MSDTTKVTDEEIEKWKGLHEEESLAGLEWDRVDEIITKLLQAIDERGGKVESLKKEIAGRRKEKKKLKARDILAMDVLEELEVRIDRISIRRDLWKIAAKKYKTLHAYCPPTCWSCGDYIHAESLGAICGECADDPTRREAELRARAETAERELKELRDDGGGS